MKARAFDAYVEEHGKSFIAEVADLCALPSVSAHGRMLDETADWVCTRLQKAGSRTETLCVAGSPQAVWAEMGEGARTLLFYNHYDVQPAEPVELWESDPFVLTERDGKLYARGVADDKADLLSRIHAIEAWRATQGELPLRVRWLVEGEEEVGSVHLGELVRRHGNRWKADGCIWEGSGRNEEERPVICCGARGMLYVELHVRTLERDLHSMYGGIVPSALWRLVGAIATLRDQDGHVLVEGMRERVRPFTESERSAIARLSFDARERRKSLGAPHLLRGLDGQDAIEELIGRPTANIAGLWGGYTGDGAKTIVPAEAHAKMDFRLVPDLTADEAYRLIVEHLRAKGFEDIQVVKLSGLDPARTPVDHPMVGIAEEAWAELEPVHAEVHPSTAATGPAAIIINQLGVPTVMTGGVGWSGDRIHSPNECIRLPDYPMAVRYWGRYLDRYGRVP